MEQEIDDVDADVPKDKKWNDLECLIEIWIEGGRGALKRRLEDAFWLEFPT